MINKIAKRLEKLFQTVPTVTRWHTSLDLAHFMAQVGGNSLAPKPGRRPACPASAQREHGNEPLSVLLKTIVPTRGRRDACSILRHPIRQRRISCFF